MAVVLLLRGGGDGDGGRVRPLVLHQGQGQVDGNADQRKRRQVVHQTSMFRPEKSTIVFRTFRYHLGTLAFGSLIISVIRMIRIMIEYVQRKLEEYGEDNVVVKV